jgi:hypothetical protein
MLLLEEEQVGLLRGVPVQGPRRGLITLPAKFKVIRRDLRKLIDAIG